ncbi:heterokaryon incompatibility protein-domain-containing protein [Dactylonectria estremocensis]|uniref:Heterokaryon incompatibility protein-domain-containing protein n=1 Tax=Dactylonectria estremocensis TaxID=1079267 RepID=A0A9P9DYK0_9HYPO|nr:heterokaryon incompatibility protein-domain-containing protein [Dactylonectria estremocensis]
MADKYRYHYLETGHIRVLHLLSVTPQITFKFEDIDLDSNPTYHTLSYTWGEPVFTKRVFIEDAFLDVTPSLHDCLLHLEAYIGIRIWIDALCINQTDDEEKGRQVQAMARVYRQAENVVIWLGSDADNSDAAMKGAETYGKAAFDAGILHLGKEQLSSWPDVGENAELQKTKHALLALMRKAAESEGDDARVEERFPRLAFAELTKRSYFTRVWVKQEITLARDTIILCGKYATSVEHLHALVLFYGMLQPWEILEWREGRSTRIPGPFSEQQLMAAESPWDLLKTASGSDAIGYVLSGRRRFRENGPSSLYQLLQQSYTRRTDRILHCKDPRDKIWGLSGIAKDMDELGLEVTYTRSMYDVYEATTRALLLQGNIDMLTWARAGVTASPSWVPNLALPIRAGWSEDVGRTLFKATGSKCQPKAEESNIVTPGAICLQGVIVDTVKDTGSIWEADPDKTFDQNAFLNMVRELIRFLEKSRYPEDRKTDAICRIPIGDKELPEASPYFVRATERSAEQFSALIEKTMDADMMATTYSYQTCMGYTYMARPVLSEQGFVGVGPSNMEAGDVIVLVFGGSTPFVLRPRTDNQGGYLLVGEAYIYGIMDGEFLEDEHPVETFELW